MKVQETIWAFTIGVTLIAAIVDFRTQKNTQLAHRAGPVSRARVADCYLKQKKKHDKKLMVGQG